VRADAATRTGARPLLLGPLAPAHRERIREIVASTGVFRPSELAVALEVFDDAFRTGQTDYELVGAFDPDDGTLLGYACYGPTPGTAGTWDLYWIAVEPAAQGRGVGTALWREVETRLRRRGARLCIVETSGSAHYEATRRFYARCGLTPVATVPDYYDDGDDRVIYAKRLNPWNP
jgi:D-alanine-D-alanine ligase